MKHVVITGASSGIGYELAKQFAAEGTVEILVIARRGDKLLELAKEFKLISDQAKIHTVEVDLAEVELPINMIPVHWDKIDILVNNAGTLLNKRFETTTTEEAKSVFQVNVFSVISLIQLCLPYLQNAEQPQVLNIGSMGGFQASSKFPGLSIYSASKATLANLTECLAEEYKGQGIRFNCLALGSVDTDMLRAAFLDYQSPISAADMANYIYQFCASGSRMYNGKVLPVSTTTP